MPVIAKIEKPEAVDHLEAIVLAFDGVMVARGDLGVELPLDQVPLVQKRAVQLCRENAKPVIVATQMLDSMIENSRPTRAEASDVANAVLDGTDAVMLSGETSVGRYPVLTVSTMAKIIDHHRGRPVRRARGCSTTRAPTAARSPSPPRRSPATRRQGAGRVLADRRHRAPAGPAALRAAAAGVHPGPRGPRPAGPVLGRGDVPDAVRRAHRRHVPPGRPAARASAWPSPATTWWSWPAPRRTRPAPPTPCGCTSSARWSTRRPL